MNNATGTLNVGSIIATAAQHYGDREMLYCVETGRRFTFREVNSRVNRLADSLRSRGIGKGDTVAFLINNRSEIVETYYALAKLGAIGMPLNYRLSATEIEDLVSLSETKALIFAGKYAGTIEQLRQTGARIARYIAIGNVASIDTEDYERLIADGDDAEPAVEVYEQDPQYFNLTSGTTGTPKAYILNHYNNALAGTLMAHQFDVSSDDVVLTVFPMYGRVGFAWTMIALVSGARNVILDFDPEEVAAAINWEKCTIVNLVPTMAQMLLNMRSLPECDLGSLRGIVFVGAALPSNVREATAQHLCKDIYEYYGMQETGAVTGIGPEAKRKRPDSVGQASLFCEVQIIDVDGQRLPPKEAGAIVVRATTATTEYYQNPEKTKETFRGGWIHTGDIGRLDPEGYLYVTGRSKDVIVTGGQNVFAAEVEDVLLQHPAVSDCAVIGLPDDFWGEVVTAIVVTNEDRPAESDLIEHSKKRVAGFKTPKRVLWRDDPLPRTPTGKVTKYSLVEEYTGLQD